MRGSPTTTYIHENTSKYLHPRPSEIRYPAKPHHHRRSGFIGLPSPPILHISPPGDARPAIVITIINCRTGVTSSISSLFTVPNRAAHSRTSRVSARHRIPPWLLSRTNWPTAAKPRCSTASWSRKVVSASCLAATFSPSSFLPRWVREQCGEGVILRGVRGGRTKSNSLLMSQIQPLGSAVLHDISVG